MKSIGIRFKVLLPVCILGILAILIAAYDSASVDSMQDGAVELQRVGVGALAALDQVSIATQKMGKMALAYTQLQGEGKEAVWGQVESANTEIEEQLAKARSFLPDDGAQEGLNAIKTATDDLYNLVKRLKECVDSGDEEQAAQIVLNDMNTVSPPRDEEERECSPLPEVLSSVRGVQEGFQGGSRLRVWLQQVIGRHPQLCKIPDL